MSADDYTDCPQCGKNNVFAETYEVGVHAGEFYCFYTGRCDACLFGFKYHHTQQVLLVPPPPPPPPSNEGDVVGGRPWGRA